MAFAAPLIGLAEGIGAGGAAAGGIGGGAAGGFAGIGQAAGGAANGLGGLTDALGQAGVNANSLTRSLNQAAPALGNFADQLSALANEAARYVQAFNPYAVSLYHQAIRDLNASVGEQLVPIVRLARDVTRGFADTIAGLTPVIRPLVEQFASTVKPLFVAFNEVLRQLATALLPLAPVVSQVFGELQRVFSQVGESVVNMARHFGLMLATIIQVSVPFAQLYLDLAGIAPLVSVLAKGFGEMALAMSRVLVTIREFLGLQPLQQPGFDNAARGKGFQPAQTTSVQSLLATLRQNAFSLGREGPQADPAKQQVNLLAEILKVLANLPKNIADAVKQAPGKAADAGVNAVVDLVQRAFGQAGLDVLNGLPRFDAPR